MSDLETDRNLAALIEFAAPVFRAAVAGCPCGEPFTGIPNGTGFHNNCDGGADIAALEYGRGAKTCNAPDCTKNPGHIGAHE